MQTEEQGNKYTKRLHFLNPSILNMQRPKANSKERWNKSSLFLSLSSYPGWVHSIRLQGVWAQLHKVEYEASWSILSREMRWRWTDKRFFFSSSKYFGYCYACCGMNKCWTLTLLFLKATAKDFALRSLLISIIVWNTAQTKQQLAKHFHNTASP